MDRERAGIGMATVSHCAEQPLGLELPVVIVSTADMDATVWTNKQHIAARLSVDRTVHYIESLGLRAPSFNLQDIKRIASRLLGRQSRRGDAMRSPRGDSRLGLQGLKVYAPLVLPFHGNVVVRRFNHLLLKRQLQRSLPERYVLWSFSPFTYGIEQNACRFVYHSVDLLHNIPGIPAQALLSAERQTIRKADALVASSKGVYDHLIAQGGRPLLWENVADIDLFRSGRSTDRERRAIFVGNLTPSKVDISILAAIVERGISLALAGPLGIDGTQMSPAFKSLLQSKHVNYLGVLTQTEMAAELGKSWVGIIPYHINNYTTGVFPMKVYEYLSSGIPVVTTALPSLRSESIPNVTIVDAKDFALTVGDICSREYEPVDGDYSANSWEARLEQVRMLIKSTESMSA